MFLVLSPFSKGFATVEDAVSPASSVQTDTGISVSAGQNKKEESGSIKVVSFSPEISEIVASIDGTDNIVATDINSVYPEQLKKLPKVADYYGVNLEALSALQFDNILLSRDFNSLIIGKLTRYKNKLRIYSITDSDELLDTIRTLGQLLHREEKAQQVINDIKQKIGDLAAGHRSQKQIRTVLVIWDKPLLVVGGSAFLNRAVKLCGGINIFEDLPIKFPAISAEKLIKGKPDAVISLVDNTENLPKSLRSKTFILTKEEQDTLMKISPRSFDIGIPAVCKAIESVR